MLTENGTVGQLTDSDNVLGAKLGLTDALTNGRSPEETAADLQLARGLKLPASYVQGMPKEERTQSEVNMNDWALMQGTTPVFLQKLRDPTFANLVKDDIANAGLIEAAVWKMAPPEGQTEGVWNALRNSLQRGLYQLPGMFHQRKLEDVHTQLDNIADIEWQLSEGVPIKELFGSESDPDGIVGYKYFLSTKEAQKSSLRAKALTDAAAVAWGNQMASLFPQTMGMQEFSQEKTFSGAFGKFMEHPLEVIANVGPESLARNAPQLLMMGGAGAAGVVPAMMATALGSYQMEYHSAMQDAMSRIGLDSSKADDVLAFYTNLDNADEYDKAQLRSRDRASAVALFDAISAGVASKTLVPAFLRKAYSARTSGLLNEGAQMVTQGVLGGAGEAAGQYATDGEITSWADVIAEFAGEFTTAPVDVFMAATKASVDNGMKGVSARTFAADVARMESFAQTSLLLQRDPQTFKDYMAAVVEARPDVKNIYVDAKAVEAAGAAQLFQSPPLAERFNDALQQGGDMRMTMDEFLAYVAPNDTSTVLAEHAHPEGLPSLVEAQQFEEDLGREIMDRVEQSQSGQTAEFQRSSAAVGETIGKMLRDAYQSGDPSAKKAADGMMTTGQIQTIQAYLQTLVNVMARDTGMLPEQVWEKYGLRGVLNKNDVTHAENGLTMVTDRAKALLSKPEGLASLAQAKGQARLTAALPNVVPQSSLEILDNAKDFHVVKPRVRQKLVGKTFTTPDGEKVSVSSKSFDKLFSNKAQSKSQNAAIHNTAVLNLDRLISASMRGWSAADRDGNADVAFRKRFAGMVIDGVPYVVKLTMKRAHDAAEKGVRAYSVEAIEVESAWQGREWLDNAAKADGYENAEGAIKTASAGVDASLSGQAVRADTIAQVSPIDLIDLLDLSHFASFGQETLGEFLPDQRVIIQWAGANRSTFLHETGHLFLNMRVQMARDLLASGAELTPSQQYFVDGTKKALAWLGTDMDSFLKLSANEARPMHEKFARTYEAYLMEGLSPNKALTNIFRRFTTWLKAVYKTVAAIPEAEINPEVRAIFDQLMTASSEIEEAKARRAQYAMFQSAEEAQMTGALWEEYLERQRLAAEIAEEELNARSARDSKLYQRLREKKFRELSAQIRERYKKLEDEEWEKVRGSKAYKAYQLLTSSQLQDDGKHYEPRLLRKDLKALDLPELAIDRLEALGLVAKESPLDGAGLAAALGYDSYDALVHDVLKLGNPMETIKANVATRVLEEFGEMTSKEKVQDAADLAVFNDERVAVLEAEVAAFNRAMGKKTDNMKVFRLDASQRVGGYTLAELRGRTKSHARSAGLRAREAAKARKAGDTVEAAQKKNQELWQATCVKEGKDRIKQVKKALKRLSKLMKSDEKSGVDTQYLILVQHILSKMGFGEEFTLTDDQRTGAIDFMLSGELPESFEAELSDVPVQVLRDLETGKYTSIGEMTCWDFMDVVGLVDELMAMGKWAKTMEVNGKKIEYAAIRHKLAQDVTEQAQSRGRKERSDREESGRMAEVREELEKIGMSHARIPSLLAAMEGTREGDMFDFIVRPAQECDSRERELASNITQKLFTVLNPIIPGLRKSKKKYYESVGASFTKQEIFVMALNMGNEGNRQRLLDNSAKWLNDNGRRLTQEDVMGLVASTLTADEINRVQEVWNLFGEMQKLIEEKEVKKRGRAPRWVEAAPVTFLSSDGQTVSLAGGYFPIVYDRRASSTGQKLEDMQTAQQMLKTAKGLSATYKGHLKSRAKSIEDERPLTLTMRGIFEGFDRAIHDVCWDEWVNNTRRILKNDASFENAVRKYWGSEAVNAIRKWHQDIATKGEGARDYGDTMANALRRGVSLVGVGFNLVTAAIQPLAITQTAAVLGPRWTLRGMSEFMKMGPRGASQFAATKSLVMRDRTRTQFRDIAEVQSLASGNTSKLAQGFMRAAYFPIVVAQMLVDLPTWLGAYNKALSEGKADADAVAVADRILLDSQGSGNLSEISGVERGGAWSKLFTVYYTFFNTALQIAMVSGHTKGKMETARDLMLVLLMQPIMETFLREALKVGPDDDESDEDWWRRMALASAGNVVEFNAGMLVGIREGSSFLKAAITGENEQYRGPTALRKITDTGTFLMSLRKAIENGEVDERVVRQAISVTADWTGWPLPVVPVTRAIKGYNALDEGKTDNKLALLLGYTEY